MAQQSPRHGIGSSSAVTAFESNLTFFLPSWPISPQKVTHDCKKTILLEPFLQQPLQCAGVKRTNLSQGQEQKCWALPLLLMWVSSVQREKGHKGAQRLPEGDSSCITQRLLSNTGLGIDLLPFLIGKHRTYGTCTNDWVWSILPIISKRQISSSTSITVKYFYSLYWSHIPGWFLLCTEKVKQDASHGK